MEEQFKNFATSTLSASITSSSTSIPLTTGSGSSFPSSGNFVVVIDTELILISSVSGDTLTVASGGRGYDGTTAASHNSAATIQLSVCAYNMRHLWSNVADTFNPIVPPIQTPLGSNGVPSGSASSYDNEMEAAGSWVLNPSSSLPSGAVFDIGQTTRSHLTFKRGTGTDNSFYVAYVAFAPGSTAWTATCKMSEGINVPANGTQSTEFHIFASDQSTPTTSNPGNAMRIDTVTTATNSSNLVSGTRQVRCSQITNNSWGGLMACPVPFGVPLYLRMNNDGAGRWQLFFGDGIAYTLLVDATFSVTVASLGVAFYSSGSNSNLAHTALVDFVRVVTGTRLQYYG
jgi:hypothetical protein